MYDSLSVFSKLVIVEIHFIVYEKHELRYQDKAAATAHIISYPAL